MVHDSKFLKSKQAESEWCALRQSHSVITNDHRLNVRKVGAQEYAEINTLVNKVVLQCDAVLRGLDFEQPSWKLGKNEGE